MNKNAIKSYAVWARTELMKQVSQKAYEYGVTENSLPELNTDTINDRLLSSDEKSQLNELVREVRKNGFEHVIEEVAYTWFNRFIALRYMEVNNYLPRDLRVRVFTNENNEFKPEILSEALHLEMNGLDTQKVFDYIEQNKQEELYKYLLLTLCNEMNEYLPFMFTSINDYKTLLFPDNLLKDDSVLARLISDIDEDSWLDQVQIIGWLYQYYIQMPKDKLIHAKKQYNTDDVPFVTQLFTPDWIVRYLVENTLGNYYVRMNLETDLTENWEYFIKNNSSSDDIKKLEDIKFIDPCMGSGHILVYAFDLLLSFYQENGYAARDAAELILRNNLYGLDIDERAYQLSYFSLMMKARQYNRKILTLGISPNIYCIKNVHIEQSLKDYLATKYYVSDELINRFNLVNENANLYGSILDVSSLTNQDIKFLYENLNYILDIQYKNLEELLFQEDIKRDLLPALRICEVLRQQYDFVVTNPPYLSSSLMPKELKQFTTNAYKDCKSDMFAVFLKKCIQFSGLNGYVGMITPYVWMFISSYETLRNYVLNNVNISGLIQLEYNAFEAACVPVATFILHNTSERYNGNYIKLSDFRGAENQGPKTIEAINNRNCGYYYEKQQNNFKKISGSPIAYWVSDKAIDLCKTHILSNDVIGSVGIQTGDNEKFIRLWTEVKFSNIKFDSRNINDSYCDEKWFPYNKGGDYRRWYGNDYFVVNWKNDGESLKKDNKITGHHYQEYKNDLKFSPCITWSRITSGNPSFRIKRYGFLNDMAGFSVFSNSLDLNMLLGFCNSIVSKYYLSFLAPTINIMIGNVLSLPYDRLIQNDCDAEPQVKKCISLSKEDWDSFETSWDFTVHPLVKNHVNTISEAYSLWDKECEERFNQLKANEEELNRIFIDIYGLQDELTPEVEDKDVTVRKADLVRDIKSYISYAVGCMFGRYSLDIEGLAYAGGDWDSNKYSTFIPDTDDIIPICDEEYFEDDIVSRFIEFVSVVYGSDTLEENLKFIADALGGKGTPREVLRNYFLNDFFKDHCNTYQVTGSGKRPIYWLFDSGKKNGFKALVYIHRYTPDLIARMRTGYIHPQQARYRTQIELLQEQIDMAASTSEKVKLSKQLKKINEQLLELNKYEEIVHHWADKMEPMDLDDGVKVNYAKFKELLAKIK
jgi:hypothetical protein